jgi:hypothetical protein
MRNNADESKFRFPTIFKEGLRNATRHDDGGGIGRTPSPAPPQPNPLFKTHTMTHHAKGSGRDVYSNEIRRPQIKNQTCTRATLQSFVSRKCRLSFHNVTNTFISQRHNHNPHSHHSTDGQSILITDHREAHMSKVLVQVQHCGG